MSSVLIVGLGSIGKRHLKNLKLLWPDLRITALRTKTESFENEDLVHKIILNLDDANDEYKFVYICSPTNFHYQYIDFFLKKGVPIFVEKPICLNLKEVLKIFTLQSSLPKFIPIYVGYVLRQLDSLKLVRQKLLDQELGKILSAEIICRSYLPDWRPTQDYRKAVTGNNILGGEILLELSHDIDYMVWLFGCPESVFGRLGRYSNLEINDNDTADAIFDYKSYQIQMHLDFCSRQSERGVYINLENGSLKLDLLNNEVFTFDLKYKSWSKVFSLENHDKNSMYIKQSLEFNDIVNNLHFEYPNVEESIKVLSIITALKKSSESEMNIKIGKNNEND
jgi:predicted dehydrogenase